MRELIMKNSNGNVLFLILIAVILFAALSYAVTSSTRSGGSDTSDENLKLKIAEMVNYTTSLRTAVQRAYLLNFYDQVHFNDEPENSNGTVFLPDGTTTTGRTVGLFSSTMGVPVIPAPAALRNSPGVTSPSWLYIYNTRLIEEGNDIGSSKGDEFLWLGAITEGACRKINQEIHGNKTIPSYTQTSGSRNVDYVTNGKAFASTATMPSVMEVNGTLPGCFTISGYYYYLEIIQPH